MVRASIDDEWTGEGGYVHGMVPVPPGPVVGARLKRLSERDRVAAGGLPSRPTRGGDGHSGWSVTAADEACLSALCRYSIATWRQCATWFYSGPPRPELAGESRSAQRRLGYLREVGWVRSEIGETWFGNVLWATPSGASVMREQMRVPLSAGGYSGNRLTHRLAVTDLGLRMESRNAVTITEREVRTMESHEGWSEQVLAACGVATSRTVRDGKGITRWLAPPIGKDGVVHWPDLVHVRRTDTDQGIVGKVEAIEVELTPKQNDRARQILLGYRDSGLFDKVIYYATADVMAQLIGYPTPGQGWSDGLLQHIGDYPSGVSPMVARQREGFKPLFEVRPVGATDEGVQFRLDMKQVPETWWVSKAQWRLLRSEWDVFCTEQGVNIPFLKWWIDRHGKRPATSLSIPVGARA